jgi:hypothetical protein
MTSLPIDDNTPAGDESAPSIRIALQCLQEVGNLFDHQTEINQRLVTPDNVPPELAIQAVTCDYTLLDIDTRSLARRVTIAEELGTTQRNIVRLRQLEESTLREAAQLSDKMSGIQNWIRSMYNY